MTDQSSTKNLALGLGLINLSGLGLGYVYQKRWRRWGIHLAVTLGLLAAAYLTNASQMPFIWLPVLILWVCWMGFDGWRLGRNLPPEQRLFQISFTEKQPWLLLVIPGILLSLVGGALAGYYFLGQNQYQLGLKAYQDSDCQTAISHFKRVTTLYELTFSSKIEASDAHLLECETLLAGDRAYQDGQFEEAIQHYQEYLDIDSDFLLTSYTEEALAESYYSWANDLMAEQDYLGAIDKFLLILEGYPDTDPADQVPAPLAESYLEQSAQFWESDKWEAAINHASIPLQEYPDTPAGKQAAEQLPEIYLDWAVNLQGYEVFSQALDKVTLVLEDFPDSRVAENAPGLAAEIYYDWASFLQGADYYQESIEKYQILLDEYSDFYSPSNIKGAIKACYLGWGLHSREIGSYNNALDTYQEFRKNYPQEATTANVDKLITETHLEWGENLAENGKFTQAMDKFTEIKESTSDPDLIAAAEEGYQEALWGLSHDQGSVGSQILQETYKTACDGEPALSPAVGITEDEPARAYSCTSEIKLEGNLTAEYPGHFKYVVDKSEGTTTVQSCKYQAGHTLIRQQLYWVITVRSTITGNVYTTHKFYGSQPEKCQPTEYFSSSTKYKYGTEPSMTEVINWLTSFFQ
jgi:tetratricopeptide (TPR) repeat protein